MNRQTKSSNKAKSGGIFMADTMTVQRTTAEMLDYMLNSDEHPVLINALPEESYIAKRIPGSVNVPIEKADLVNKLSPTKIRASLFIAQTPTAMLQASWRIS